MENREQRQLEDVQEIPDHWEGDYTDLNTDDFLPSAKPDPGPLYKISHKDAFGPTLYWSMVIVIVTVANWLYGKDWQLLASYQSTLGENKLWQAWSSLFIHADIGHLLSNLWLFAVFGYLLRAFWGAFVFPFLSFSLLGGLTTILTILHYGPGPRLLGASGMIYGMIGLWLVTYLRYELRYSFKTRVFRSIGFILLMLFPTTITHNVSYSAHFIGFVIGAGLGAALISRAERSSSKLP